LAVFAGLAVEPAAFFGERVAVLVAVVFFAVTVFLAVVTFAVAAAAFFFGDRVAVAFFAVDSAELAAGLFFAVPAVFFVAISVGSLQQGDMNETPLLPGHPARRSVFLRHELVDEDGETSFGFTLISYRLNQRFRIRMNALFLNASADLFLRVRPASRN